MPVSLLGFLISGCYKSLCANHLGCLYSDSSRGEQLLVEEPDFSVQMALCVILKKSLLFSLPSKFLLKLQAFSGPVVLSRTICEVMKMPQVWFD